MLLERDGDMIKNREQVMIWLHSNVLSRWASLPEERETGEPWAREAGNQTAYHKYEYNVSVTSIWISS
jgi:hypothetical protein